MMKEKEEIKKEPRKEENFFSTKEISAVFDDSIEINPTIDDLPIAQSPFEEERKSVVRFANLENLSAQRIWGIVLVRLREEHFMTLHTAGGEVRDIKLVNDKLVAKVKQESLYNILIEPENFEQISLHLKQINDKLQIEFVLDLPKLSQGEQNLPLVKDLFGEFLQVKE